MVQDHPARMTRRSVLAAGGVLGGSALLELAPGGLLRAALAQPSRGISMEDVLVELVDSDVQMRLTLELSGLAISGGEIVATGEGPTRIAVRLGSQHTSEEAFAEGTTPPGGAIPSRSARPTRLVFDVIPPIPYTAEALLDWSQWIPILDGRAAFDEATADTTTTGPIAQDLTAIHLPEAVELSPLPDGRVLMDASGARNGRYSQGWAARLGRVVGPAIIPVVTDVRALHTTGYVAGQEPSAVLPGFGRILTDIDRQRLVQATGDWSDTALEAYPAHEPISSRLTFGPAGASGHLSGSWGTDADLTDYFHVLANGRTSTLTVVRSGYLMPFGHRVQVAEVGTRVFTTDAEGVTTAVLSTALEVLVGDGVVSSQRTLRDFEGRDWPFDEITLVAPGVVLQQEPIPGADLEQAYAFTDADGELFRFAYSAADRLGAGAAGFTLPGVFIAADVAFDTSPGGAVAQALAWIADQPAAFAIDLDGDVVAMADVEVPEQLDVVRKALFGLTLDVVGPSRGTTADALRDAGEPAFGPVMVSARVTDPLGGSLAGADQDPVTVTFNADWLALGLADANLGGSFLDLATPVELTFGGLTSNVLGASLSIEEFNLALGSSIALGEVGDTWDPVDALGLAADLFGVLPLPDILPPVTIGADPAAQPDLPRITVRLGDTPDVLCAEFRWEPPLETLRVAGTATFVVTGDFAAEGLDTGVFDAASSALVGFEEKLGEFVAAPTPEPVAEIRNVALRVPPGKPLLDLYLARAGLDATTPDIDIADVRFTGDLAFMDVLQDVLDFGGGGPVITLDPESPVVFAGVEIAVPDLEIGAIALGPFSVVAGLEVPLADDAEALVRLDVGNAEDPIYAAMGSFRGEAYFNLAIAPHPAGLRTLTVSVGLGVGLRVGTIVQVSVEGFLSITFAAEIAGGITQYTLTACIDLTAGIDLAGFVEFTGEVIACLSYNLQTRILTGSVYIAGTVELASAKVTSVSGTAEVAYALGELDTPFRQASSAAGAMSGRYTEAQWLDYCGKFA